jgi:hypothetical protein
VFLRKLLSDVVRSRKTRKATSDNDHIGFMAASQGFIDHLVLEINCFKPIIVDKIFIEIRWPQILAPVM